MIEHSKNVREIEECLPVLAELRPKLRPDELLERIQGQMRLGYQLVAYRHQGQISTVAGFWLLGNLARGRFLQIDDFVTRSVSRRQGHGQRLWNWLVEFARSLDCGSIHLDSGHHRLGAHSFYENVGMKFTSRHYSYQLAKGQS